jgi:hypothetical protein
LGWWDCTKVIIVDDRRACLASSSARQGDCTKPEIKVW